MKKIIVAPLNWGLGHATRCVPIIQSLLENQFLPIIAGDGKALHFLQKEFPELETIQLPSYNITYAKHLKWHLFLQTPKIRKAIALEKRVIEQYIDIHKDVVGVISDNRFGARSTKVPSVYITHQVQVLSGWTTFLTSQVHQRIIKQFDECWVPDEEDATFSGRLSNSAKQLKVKRIGILSRFKKEEKQKKYDIAVILSGLEPHRSNLEKKLFSELKYYKGQVVFVRGIIETTQKKEVDKNIVTYNYLLSRELQDILNASKVVISRAGYSSIMDYATLEKKAILIPTLGQTEQEYLGNYLAEKGKVVRVNENTFSLDAVEKVKKIKGLVAQQNMLSKELFSLFQGERKL